MYLDDLCFLRDTRFLFSDELEIFFFFCISMWDSLVQRWRVGVGKRDKEGGLQSSKSHPSTRDNFWVAQGVPKR